jgi:sugar lactone lactonase YvrE
MESAPHWHRKPLQLRIPHVAMDANPGAHAALKPVLSAKTAVAANARASFAPWKPTRTRDFSCGVNSPSPRKNMVPLHLSLERWTGLFQYKLEYAACSSDAAGEWPMIEIECLWESDDLLGESPIWNPTNQSVYWSDHAGPSLEFAGDRRPTIRKFNPSTGEQTSWTMPEQVGSFAFRNNGELLVGTNSGFGSLNLETQHIERWVDPESDNLNSRLNDGKADRMGRYWCGSMDCQLQEDSARIYRLDADRTVTAVAEDFSFVCSNGIAFDPEDTRMYFGDTKRGMIYVFDFDLESGTTENRRPFFNVAEYGDGIVDGATVDQDGCYWFALNLGGKIIRLAPDGKIDRVIEMPVRSPTCVTFGGNEFDIMYVTSQQTFLTDEELTRHPRPGSIFAIHGLGVKGVPEPFFGS